MHILQPQESKVYGIHVPLSEFIVVGCKEAGCQSYLKGFQVRLLVGRGDDFGDKVYYEITHSKMKYTEEKTEDGWTVLTFEAGQNCFKGLAGQHRRRKENAREFYIARDGLTGRVVKHTRPEFWIEDSGLQLDKWATIRQRG